MSASAAGAAARLWLDCRGVVQGVGFRPLVHRLAAELALAGAVENVAGGVRVELQGERGALERFLERLPRQLQPPAALEPLHPLWLEPMRPAPRGLRIAAAAARPLGTGLVAPALAADLAPCRRCLAELEDPLNRRFGYPFISCSACGPRYSIATAEPYARAHTTLAAFPLCAACRREFEDPGDRRFHAETIGCPACGPRLRLWTGVDPAEPAGVEPIAAAAALLRQGRILALQGVGGFQLLVDATDPGAVSRLRRRKRRPDKPFALLVDDPAALGDVVTISPEELVQLRSSAAPIVLLRRTPPGAGREEAFAAVAPGSPCLGVMLPASPLHLLLARAVGRPLVATSGNRSGELLQTDPRQSRAWLGDLADAVLEHDRPIARPLDDSLLQLVEGRPRMLRRARGYAPTALALPAPPPPQLEAIALGGDLKAAPALLREGRLWLAPHLGDLAGARQQQLLERWLLEQAEQPGSGGQRRIVCDAHPGYVSHRLACAQAVRQDVRPVLVQHHRAHGLAVAAEHGLPLPLLVWACDGLGFADGAAHRLWGGELLLLHAEGAERLAGLRPFPLPGGERAMREPRRVALGLLVATGSAALLEHPGARACRRSFAAGEWELLVSAVRAGCQAPLSSGMGRLFDGVASLLDVCQHQSHEGQAGLWLEGLARRATAAGGGALPLPLRAAPGLPLGWLDWQPLLETLLEALRQEDRLGAALPDLAARFHHALATAMATTAAAAVAARAELAAVAPSGTPVALAGGCFQNALLLELTATALRRVGLVPFWGEQVPCHDGGLALGQLWALLGRVPITRSAAPAIPCAWPPRG
ncbi:MULTISPECIES: carbamoyltransferase HypF [Aphanothece]|uniref:carbamoyltransferase HypF n=1 Tax=Aphanothece TaxID=1121 RepID=UPI003984C445